MEYTKTKYSGNILHRMIVVTRLTLVTVLLRHNPILQQLKWTSVFRILWYSVKHKMRSACRMQLNTRHTDAMNACSFSFCAWLRFLPPF